MLKQNGIFYLSLPNLARLRSRVRLLMGRSIHPSIDHFYWELSSDHNMVGGIHWREYTMAEIAQLLRRTGFTIHGTITPLTFQNCGPLCSRFASELYSFVGLVQGLTKLQWQGRLQDLHRNSCPMEFVGGSCLARDNVRWHERKRG